MYETQERTKRMTDIHVLWGQSTVVEELIRTGKIDEEYLYPLTEKKYWNGGWLPRGCPRLREGGRGEIIIDELGAAAGGDA